MRSDIVPGGTFPDYELPDQDSVPRKLSELQGDDPLILTLARGQYCPKEHQQHLQLTAFYPQIAVALHQDRHDRVRNPSRDARASHVRRGPMAVPVRR